MKNKINNIKNKVKKNKTVAAKAPPFDIKKEQCSLLQAQVIGYTSQQLDFDWDHPKWVLKKVKEEYTEVKDAFAKSDMVNLKEEIGDLLFAIVQFARHNQIDAEEALSLANQKFIDRLTVVFAICEENKKDYFKTSFKEKDKLWKLAKKRVRLGQLRVSNISS
jgi:uncharacterized protein YabN with tetrapyrrole methylase and pyrophosphatase domain